MARAACYTTARTESQPRCGRDEEPAMPLKKLGHVVLKVRDLDRSEAFYTDVVEKVSPGPYVELFGRRPRSGWTC